MCSHLAIAFAAITTAFLLTECKLNFVHDHGFHDFSQFRDFDTIHPRIFENMRRVKRDVTASTYFEEDVTEMSIQLGNWILDLDSSNFNSMVFHPTFEVAFVNDHDETDKKCHRDTLCDFRSGHVRGFEAVSSVAMTICGSDLTGYVRVGDEIYFVEPLRADGNAHIIYTSTGRAKRSATTDYSSAEKRWEYYNLTGDVMELDVSDGDEGESTQAYDNEDYLTDFLDKNVTLINLEPKSADDDELGYFVDTAWESTIINRKSSKTKFTSPPMWLEIALAVDQTVINFHGRDRVQQYVLSLLNIVNAIYQDPSLDANLQLVITRLFFYESKKSSMIRLGDARKSLQNVNTWNKRLLAGLAPGEPQHDVAIWLTRADIGGPSGYAPVAGACDPKRSCTLNRDEGLTSAFIIAHELAHILGLSHDGEQKSGNTCGGDTYYGSVMAPMVSSTFHKFVWSDCSKKEFHQKSSKFSCLLNPPPRNGNAIILNSTLQSSFNMDEQCRMEFGEGYSLCRSFDIIEVCSHLWCGHDDSPLVCKTKKGPPIEGTDCGFDKWCISGYCEPVDRRRFGRNPVHHNPQNGRWSTWSPWGACSRTCGIGVAFRTRKCDNPPAMYGGNNCFGLPEEWKICNVDPCLEPIQDFRAQQCSNLPKYFNLEKNHKANMTWLPFASDDQDTKCKLICISKETREVYITDENLIDGTPCSYESSMEVCIQGICHHIGCDGKLFSNTKPDSCGVCGGNNTNCEDIKSTAHRKLKRDLSKILVLPRLARGVKIEVNFVANVTDPSVAFMLKDRSRHSYSVTVPNIGAHGEIMAGTKFRYKKFGDRHVISANGPLLSEIILFVFVPRGLVDGGIKILLKSEYYINRDSLNGPRRHVWVLGGWGPCSKSCGGGIRHKTTACFDTQTNKLVPRKLCSLLTRPHVQTEKCNAYSCNFHWVPGGWEACTKTCGSHGVQNREVYCFPQSVMNSTDISENSVDFPWKSMVSPSKCGGNPPSSIRHCNRIPCPSFWQYDNWSECSASCGTGISIRNSQCPPPDNELFFTCGPSPPQQKKTCRGLYNKYNNPSCRVKQKKFNCRGDQSRYCPLASLSKYCSWGFFRKYCCKTCMKASLHEVTS